ncbi:hypothetical protein AGOR_G00238100 [Albula goreensis]|uniref:Chemokine interleukin-8-like domain-containing protein n=1 Tax=Albula goreensis TaxID=1534307 RepID=A0A8T3CJ54_9TELE|nr:hypothetical protein AGOR_G00238100 [Albula goreensis]
MKISVVAFSAALLAVALVGINGVGAQSRGSCCLNYSKGSDLKKIPLNAIKEYRIQEVTGNCHIQAVLFVTVKGQRICANPRAKNVKRLLKNLRKRKNKTQDSRRGRRETMIQSDYEY